MIALVYLYWVALLFVFGGEFNAAIIRDSASPGQLGLTRERPRRAAMICYRANVAPDDPQKPSGSPLARGHAHPFAAATALIVFRLQT